MIYVVTGGAGFIGSNVVAEIERRGLGEVIVVDDCAQEGQWRNLAKRSLAAIHPASQLKSTLDQCPKKTVIIHMGARSSTSDTDVAEMIRVNTQLTCNLFLHAAEAGWPFVYASSAQVYGLSAIQSDDDQTILRPITPYGWSKALADQRMMKAGASGFGPPIWAGLRFFNVYGAREDHKGNDRSFVTRCFDAIRCGEAIKLFRGSDGFLRDWVSVEDCARLVVDIASGSAGPIRGIFNVGTGAATSFADVATACILASGKSNKVSTTPFPAAMIGSYQPFTRAATEKLASAMPDFGFTTLEDGVRRYWEESASKEGMDRFL